MSYFPDAQNIDLKDLSNKTPEQLNTTATPGTGTKVSREDHVHPTTGLVKTSDIGTTPPLDLSTASSAGTSIKVAREDHVHSSTGLLKTTDLSSTNPVSLSSTGTATVGTSTKVAREDHVHALTGLVTSTDANNTYVKKAGDTITGTLTFNNNICDTPKLKSWTEIVNDMGTVSGNVVINLSIGNIVKLRPSADITISFTNCPAGVNESCGFSIVISNGGAYTVTWPTNIRWSDNVPPQLSTSGEDLMSFLTVDSGSNYFGIVTNVNASIRGFGEEPGTVYSSTSGSAGVLTTVSRSDHSHDLGAHTHNDETNGGQISHDSLLNLTSDSHTQYILADGTRAFTGTISGIAPTAASHLSTKGYVDTYIPSSANKLTTARSISLAGDISGSTSFDGSQNVTITTTIADNSHYHDNSTLTSIDWTKLLNVPTSVSSADGLYVKKAGDTITGTLTFNKNICDGPKLKNWTEIVNDMGEVSGAISVNLSTGGIIKLSPTDDTTISFTNCPSITNESCGFVIVIANGGNFNITWPNNIRWSDNSPPTLSTSGDDIISFLTIDAGTTYFGITPNVNAAIRGFGGEPGVVYSSTSGAEGISGFVSRADHSHDLGLHAHTGASNGGQIDHSDLTGLDVGDTHTQYVLVDGTRALTGTISGITPTADAHLATKGYVDNIIAAQDAMVFKGTLDASSSPNYPAADRGHTYKISVAGKIGGTSGINVEAGDMIICTVDGTTTGSQSTVGSNWAIVQANIDGAVTGPTSSVTDNFISFSGTTGKVIKDSGKKASDFANATHTHTPTEVGLSNVTNNAQIKKNASSTSGNIPTWNGNTGDSLNDGYSVETTLTGSVSAIPSASAVKTYIDNNATTADGTYIKKTGDTVTGTLTFTQLTSPVVFNGTAGNYYPAVQDGRGRVNWYWNAIGGKFDKPSEDATNVYFGASQDAMSGTELFSFKWADGTGKVAGDTINWTTLFNVSNTGLFYKSNTVWHAGNDGAGSTLDADLLDGLEGSSYILTDGTRAFTGVVSGVTPTSAAHLATKSYVDSQVTSGTVTSAAKLTTARNIAITGDVAWNVNFDGSTNVTAAGTLANSGVSAGTYNSSTSIVPLTIDAKGRVTAAGTAATIVDLNTAQTLTNKTISGSFSGALTGNASTSTKLASSRSISMTGDVTWTTTFDGSADVTAAGTLANSGVSAGTYNNVATQVRPFTVDAKGRVTSIGTAVTIAPAWSSITSKPTTVSGYGITNAVMTDTNSVVADSIATKWGTGGDLGIWHDGTNSVIENITGSLNFRQKSNTSVMNFFYNNGTTDESMITATPNGGVSLYYNGSAIVNTISGGATINGALTATGTISGATPTASGHLTTKAYVDAQVTSGVVSSAAKLTTARSISMTGDVTWTTTFDGSADVTAAGTLANSGVGAGTYNNVATQVRPFTVDAKGRVTGIGTAVTIAPAWSSITSKPTTVSGYGITNAVMTDTNSTVVDNISTKWGTGGDLNLYHDGTSSYVDNTTGNLYLRSFNNTSNIVLGYWTGSATENMIVATPNSGISMYYDNVKKFETTAAGATVTGLISCSTTPSAGTDLTNKTYVDTQIAAGLPDQAGVTIGTYNSATQVMPITIDKKGRITTTGTLTTIAPAWSSITSKPTTVSGYGITNAVMTDTTSTVADNINTKWGTGGDLNLVHNGTDSIIYNTTGSLYLRQNTNTSNFIVDYYTGSAFENMIVATPNGSVATYYDNVKKLETTASGAKVSGDMNINDKVNITYNTTTNSLDFNFI